MNDELNESEVPVEKAAGAFAKDQAFGNRLDQAVALHEAFLLLGGKIEAETQTTTYGEAEVAKVLIQKLSSSTGAPAGPPIKCVTVASAIVEKVKALTPEDLAAGPIVQLQIVRSKGRGGKEALVMSWIRNLTDEDDFSEFGIDQAQASQVADLARAPGQRLPL